jgi:type II secretory pathway pseudopilin PulG
MEHEPAIRSGEDPLRRGAFALIEIIGALAVLSILGLALAPVLIRHADIAAVNSETANLGSISNALVVQVLRSNSIPSEASATWPTAVGNWIALPSASIATNARNHARAYLVDSSGWLGANLPTSGYYTQSVAGTVSPGSARIMLVSSLSADLPVPSGRPSPASFNNIWNTAPNAIPSTWTTWKGRGDDLLIQRINLEPFFSQLILVNHDADNTAAYVLAGQTNVVTGHSILNAYYINGSVVGLGSTGSGSTILQTSHVLNGNISFVFESGTWGGQIGKSTRVGSTNLVSTNASFLIAANFKIVSQAFLAAADSPNNANPGGAAGDQEQVLAAMSDFMAVYALWSQDGFSSHGMASGDAKNHLSVYHYLKNSATTLSQAAGTTRNISSAPYYSGLLY